LVRTDYPRRSRWATTLLGAILSARGAGKLFALGAYTATLSSFPLVGEAVAPALARTWAWVDLLSGGILLAAGLVSRPDPRWAAAGALGALASALGGAVLVGHAFGVRAPLLLGYGLWPDHTLSVWVLVANALWLWYTWSQVGAISQWGIPRHGGKAWRGWRLPDDRNGWKDVTERPFRILVLAGSDRRQYACPGVDSKARMLALRMAESMPAGWEVDVEDLGNVELRARIQSCNGCVSTSMALCVWPCNCYRPGDRGAPDLMWDLDLYARLDLADALVVIGPVYWYGPTSNLKLLFDRLVCMNGGNPDERTIGHKDPERAMALERTDAWQKMSVNHLEGRTAAFFCYGDGGGDELDPMGWPKILRHPQYFDPVREPFEDMRDAYAPLVWQCRYGGIEVPDALWCYGESGRGKRYSDNQAEHLADEQPFLERFDGWAAEFVRHVGQKGKVTPGRWRAFGVRPKFAPWQHVALWFRALRIALHSPKPGSSPAKQQSRGLNVQ
jgi:multimeric flavodoxin WrbA